MTIYTNGKMPAPNASVYRLDKIRSLSSSSIKTFGKALVKTTQAATLSILCAAVAQAAPEKTTINIGVGPGWGAGGHAIIAAHNGYFKNEGFSKVELKTFPAGMMQLEAMVSGAVDVSNPTQAPVLTLRSNGLPVVVLASLAIVDRTMGVVIRDSANVTSPKQLEGMKIGLLKGSGAEQMLQLLCKDYNIDCTKIQITNLPPPAQLASLSSGAIDGMITWQPWIYQAQQKEKVSLVHTGTNSNFEANRGQPQRIDFTRTILASTEGFVKSNPKTIDALLRAYIKAQAFIADPKNYDQVVEIYSKFFNEDQKINHIILKDNTNSLALDNTYLSDMDAVRDFLSKTGRLRHAVDTKKLTDGAPLAAIDKSLVNLETK